MTGLPNGASSYPGDEGVTLFNQVIPFDFDNGALAGDLRERVIQYSQQNAYHPYGGLYFDYEIALTSGDVTGFSATGWAGFEVAVKECGISICGGSGANGVSSDRREPLEQLRHCHVLVHPRRSRRRHAQREFAISHGCVLLCRSFSASDQ